MYKRGFFKIFGGIVLISIIILSLSFIFADSFYHNLTNYENKDGISDKVAVFDNAKAELITPKVNYVMPGKDRKVMIFEIENFGDVYKNGLKDMEIFNINQNGKRVNKKFHFEYAVYDEVPVYVENCYLDEKLFNDGTNCYENENRTISCDEYNDGIVCEMIKNGTRNEIVDWKKLKSNDIPKGKIRIALVTDVELGDHFDGIPILFDKRISHWAEWTEAMNIGLKAYWYLNYTREDAVGNNDLDITGSEVYVTGISNVSIDMDGTGNGYMTKDILFNLNENVNWTIAMWLYEDTHSIYETIFGYGEATNYKIMQFSKGTNENQFSFLLDTDCTGGWEESNTNIDVGFATGGWHNIIFKYEGTNLSVWNDGVCKWSKIYSSICFGDHSFFQLGKYFNGPYYFDGQMDEIAIWNRSLTTSEISDLYNGGIGIFYIKIIDTTVPTWKNNWTDGSNLTKNGEVIHFNITLEDDIKGGNYVFSFDDGTGNFVNDTPVSWTTPQEVEITKTITAIKNQKVRWRWYFSDLSENKNETPIWDFIIANSLPIHSKPLLVTSTGKNLSSENLICSAQNVSDADNDEVTNIYNWYKNSQPLLDLNLPFETNTNDYSGNNNHGIVYGAILIDGKYGSALDFDGNDYIEISDSDSLDFNDMKSWQLWFKRATTGEEILFDKGDGTNSNYKLKFLSNDKLNFFYSVVPGWISSLWELKTKPNFDEGNYNQTYYNETNNAVMLNNYGGDYTSKIFNDSGKELSFNTISWNVYNPTFFKELSAEEGMIGLWHLNEQNGTIVDYSGKGNNGTQSGGVTYNVAGKINTAFSFDGTNDYVNFGNIANFNRTDPFSLEVWFKTTTSSNDALLDRYGSNKGWTFYLADGKLVFALSSAVGDYIKKTTVNTYTDGAWYHAVLTYSGTGIAGGVILYINGEVVSMDTNANSLTGTTLNNLNCSLASRGESLYFEGTLDETAIYNKTLNASEIQEHYNKGMQEHETDATFYVRSCDDVSCSGESWISLGETSPQNLAGKVNNNTFFQFKSYFTTDDTAYSPKLYNVTLNYLKQTLETEANITSITAITNDNQWHLTTITFNITGENNLKLYLDNKTEPDAQKTESSLPVYQDNNLTIAKFFNGTIDEFRIYDYALTQEQINANYNLEYNKIVNEETAGGDNYMCQVTPNDGEADGVTWNSTSLNVLWAITFNVTYGEDGSQESNFNIDCDNGFSISGINSPYTTGFESGSYVCVFSKTERYDETIIFTVNNDKIVNVKLSRERQLTIEEHTWLEAIYNCIILKDCDLYNLLLEINQTVGNIWEHTKPTDKSVITFENVTNKIVNSTHNLTIDYSVNIPIKAGYSLGTYLPIRIGYWFLDSTNITCYNQGSKPVGVEDPYCQPLVIETIGPMGGSINFTVKLHPSLPTGNYNIKQIIDIDPNNVWINYGQEVISSFVMAESLSNSGISLKKTAEAMPSTPTPSSNAGGSGGGGSSGGSVINVYNTYVTKTGESEKENKNTKPVEDKLSDSSKVAGITGGVIGTNLLSKGSIIVIVSILCGTFIIFIIVRYKTIIRIKKKLK